MRMPEFQLNFFFFAEIRQWTALEHLSNYNKHSDLVPINTKLVTKCEHNYKRYTRSCNLILWLSSYYHLPETQNRGSCLYLDHYGSLEAISATEYHWRLQASLTEKPPTRLLRRSPANLPSRPEHGVREPFRLPHYRKCHRYLLNQCLFIWGQKKTHLCWFHLSPIQQIHIHMYMYA